MQIEERIALFQVASGGSAPIYRQLVEQVERLILARQLAAGEMLPSVRELAEALGVNPMTISKAYGVLEQGGWVERRRGMGMAVCARTLADSSAPARLAHVQESVRRLVQEAKQLQLSEGDVQALMTKIWKGDKE